jgi:nucleotide-binding universal stress UspA family protein
MVNNDNKDISEHLSWAKNILEAAEFVVVTSVASGEVKKVLCDYRDQNNIGLVIMGACGHSKIRQFLVGSTTTKMIQQAMHVPLLLLR